MHLMSIEVSCDLVAANELPDPAVIELAEIEVEDSSYQFEVNAIRTQFSEFWKPRDSRTDTSLEKEKRKSRPIKLELDVVTSSSFTVISLGDKRLYGVAR